MVEELVSNNANRITEEEQLRKTIADNLSYYRKMNNLTQAKLAELLNYSDKAVSKWERGDGVPDIYILKKLAEIYKITVNDLISSKKKKTRVSFFKNRLVITLLSVGLDWLVAVILFSILLIIDNNIPSIEFSWLWLIFIYPIPVAFIIALVFAKIWGKRWHRFFLVTGIVWGVGLTIFCQMYVCHVNDPWIIWLICAAVQVLVFLWYLLRRKKKEELE